MMEKAEEKLTSSTSDLPEQKAPLKSSLNLPCCSKTLLIPIILAGIVLVLGVGYLAGAKILSPKISPPVSPQVTPQPTPTPDPTANWEAYNNTKYSYSVKYPGDWFIYEMSGNLTTDSISLSQVKLNSKKDNDVPNVKIIIWRQNSLTNGGGTTMLGGLPAYRSTSEGPAGILHDIVFLSKGKYDYSVELEYEQTNKDQYLKIFNQILSTFKFLDQEQASASGICANNKKTYRSLKEASIDPEAVCHLDLSSKNLTRIPPEVLKFKNLESIYLNFNKLTLFPVELAELKNLKLIDVTGNPLDEQNDPSSDRIKQLFPNTRLFFLKPMNLP